MSDRREPFGQRTVVLLIAIGVISIGIAVVFALLGAGTRSAATAGTNSFSRSAVGHRAFVEMLRGLGHRVLVSRSNSGGKLGERDLLVILEPDSDYFAGLSRFSGARRILLVLPKWQGEPDPAKPDWIGHATLKSEGHVTGILRDVLSEGTVVRAGVVSEPLTSRIGARPTLPAPQLVSGVPDRMAARSLAYSRSGNLVVDDRRNGRSVFVVSDPDVFANFGIVQGENARFAARLIDRILPEGGAVVIDETVHGFIERPNLLKALFRYPFLISTLIAAATLMVLVWATARRFGTPAPEAPALEGGKAGLIDNTAGLLTHGGHYPEIVARYAETARQEVTRRLHAPRGPETEDEVVWLDRVGLSRGAARSYSELMVELADLRVSRGIGVSVRGGATQLARRINQWQREMLDGGAGNTRHRGPDEAGDSQGRRRSGGRR